METITYFIYSLILYAAGFLGVLAGFVAPEEIIPGEKYLFWTRFLAFSVFVMFFSYVLPISLFFKILISIVLIFAYFYLTYDIIAFPLLVLGLLFVPESTFLIFVSIAGIFALVCGMNELYFSKIIKDKISKKEKWKTIRRYFLKYISVIIIPWLKVW